MERGLEIWVSLTEEEKTQVLNGVAPEFLSPYDFSVLQDWINTSLRSQTSTTPFNATEILNPDAPKASPPRTSTRTFTSATSNVPEAPAPTSTRTPSTGPARTSTRTPSTEIVEFDQPVEAIRDSLNQLATEAPRPFTPGFELDISKFISRFVQEIDGLIGGVENEIDNLNQQIADTYYVGADVSEQNALYYASAIAFLKNLNEFNNLDDPDITIEDLFSGDTPIRVKDFEYGAFKVETIRTFANGFELLDALYDADPLLHPGTGIYETEADIKKAQEEISKSIENYSEIEDTRPELVDSLSDSKKELARLSQVKFNLNGSLGIGEIGTTEEDLMGPVSDEGKLAVALNSMRDLQEYADFRYLIDPLENLRQSIAPGLESISLVNNPELSAAMRSNATAESERLLSVSTERSVTTERPDASAFGTFVPSERPDASAFGQSAPSQSPSVSGFDPGMNLQGGQPASVEPVVLGGGNQRPDASAFGVVPSQTGEEQPGSTPRQPWQLPSEIQYEVVEAMTSLFGIRAAFWNLDENQLKIGVDRNGLPVDPNSSEALRVEHLLSYISGRKITDENRILAAVEQTPWYRSTNASMREFDAKYGGLEAFLSLNPENQLDKIGDVYTVVESGFKQLGVQVSEDRMIEIAATLDYLGYELDENEIFTAVMEEAKRVENQFNAETAEFTEFASSRDAVQSLAQQYYLNLPASVIADYAEQLFTRDMTVEKLGSIFREQASARFAQDVRVQSALNAGMTLEQYFAPYQGELERILERPVDLFSEFPEVLEFMGSDGDVRAMTYSEMRQFAREQPEWAQTTAAQDAATEMVFELGRLFGTVA